MSGPCVEIRVRGTVQGVGFRPAVWKLANEFGLTGEVLNDSEGVLVRLITARAEAERFAEQLRQNAPPLARIEQIEFRDVAAPANFPQTGFRIAESHHGAVRTRVSFDAATCKECRDECLSPFERRFRYPFTNCTHCGPRLSLIERVPYDRAHTTMTDFPMCEECAREYGDPADRRFHAQPIACHKCGPRAHLARMDGKTFNFDQFSMLDEVDAVATLIQRGMIVAIKGLGGYQLCCDATNAEAIATLRERKRRDRKPFALMARDMDVIRRYCAVSAEEEAALADPSAPIVLLETGGAQSLPESVAPGLNRLGFMLPNTPLHHLMLKRHDRPVIMTSGNLSDEPQVIEDAAAMEKLNGIADYMLTHNRRIANRVDDSVAQMAGGRLRLIRRARGYAPAPVALPEGFGATPDILACGGELKSVFGLAREGSVILSQHQGDLEHAAAFADYENNLSLYTQLFDHKPVCIAIDAHPDYLSSKLGVKMAAQAKIPLLAVQHHHAHVASCMAENGWARNQGKVMGVALDGLGYGLDGMIWGGEFMLADYDGFTRMGTFKPVAMPGGAQAIREPWRNTYAHIMAEIGWNEFAMNFSDLELFADLAKRPHTQLNAIIKDGTFAPRASSCGRLFDAVGAALGFARDRAGYEGEAAVLLEAVVDREALARDDDESYYPFAIPNLKGSNMPYIEPIAMWRALLGDLVLDTPVGVISARFHQGLARVIVKMVDKLCHAQESDTQRITDTVVLSGGCFHNAVLLELVTSRLERLGFRVLTQSLVPAGDGGLALGQAAIAAARMLREG